MIYDYYKQFPDVHPNIILKAELNRLGQSFTKEALDEFKIRDDIHWKGYHLFSYDVADPIFYGAKIPNTFNLEDGSSVYERTNPESPYYIDYRDGRFVITERGEIIADNLRFHPKPRWYDMKLEDGTPMQAIINYVAGGVLFCTFNKYCELWNAHDECLFCDINAQMRGQRDSKDEVIVARKDPKVITEVMKVIRSVDPQCWCIYISGGTILGKYQGQTEVEFYATRLEALREGMGGTWLPSVVQIAVQDDEGWKRLHETGVSSVQSNIEVWGKEMFEWLCPGKKKFFGWDNWIRGVLRSVDFWGEGKVNPSFVLGLDMAQPHGFKDVKSAVKNFASGIDFLMDHGVVPRYAYWTIEPKSALRDNQSPPLEYYIEAEKAYAEIRWKHNYDPPIPATWSRFGYIHSAIWDFEYYHGSGPYSKKYQDAAGGPSEHEICRPGDGFGFKA